MTGSFTPVPYEFREMLQEAIEEKKSGKIFFFNDANALDDAAGRLVEVTDVQGDGMYAVLETTQRIRIDRIITLYGKPGAAYDEYNAYGNVCLDCSGGYPL